MILAVLLILGAALRLWHWTDQMLLDDEWHALNFVFNRSFKDIMLQQGMGANSMPVNVYSWILLHSAGWSEPLLRLPSMLAGISALFVLPMLVKRIWGTPVAVVTAALLSISPVLIFYSRILRPYAPAVLLATSSVLLTLAWMKDGKRRDIVISALCGSLAIYYHLYTAIPVGVPMLVAFFVTMLNPLGRRFGLILESKRAFTDILIAGIIMSVIDGILVVVPNVINPWWSHGIHDMDHANIQTAVTVLSLISGTRNALLMATTLGLLLTGLVIIFIRSRIYGTAITLSFLIFSVIMANTTQDGAHAGIQVARYGLTFIPLSFVAIAVAFVWIADSVMAKYECLSRPLFLLPAAAMLWFPFIVTSPLSTTYDFPNNFTNHSAYQYRYDPIEWNQRSPERDLVPGISLNYSNIPPFYLNSQLFADARGIIEYPMMIGDHMNLYYYYQHFHRLPVVAGFVSNGMYVRVSPGRDFVYGDWPIDSVMGAMPEPLRRKSSWRTMVDLSDARSLSNRYKGWMVIVHRNPPGEIIMRDSFDNRMSLNMADFMAKTFGSPRFMDGQLGVWMIQ